MNFILFWWGWIYGSRCGKEDAQFWILYFLVGVREGRVMQVSSLLGRLRKIKAERPTKRWDSLLQKNSFTKVIHIYGSDAGKKRCVNWQEKKMFSKVIYAGKALRDSLLPFFILSSFFSCVKKEAKLYWMFFSLFSSYFLSFLARKSGKTLMFFFTFLRPLFYQQRYDMATDRGRKSWKG